MCEHKLWDYKFGMHHLKHIYISDEDISNECESAYKSYIKIGIICSQRFSGDETGCDINEAINV